MNDLMEIRNTITSREIATLTEKEHKSVIRDIKNLTEQLGNADGYSFVPTSYTDNSNRNQPMFLLNKKASLLLASGYNVVLRAKIIDRWEELETKLQDSYMIADPIERAKRWIEEQQEKLMLEEQIKQQQPLVDFANQVSESVNSISIGDFAKLLKDERLDVGQNRLFKWLRDNKYLRSHNTPYQTFIERGYFDVIEQTYDTAYGKKTSLKTLVTGKGQIYFTEKLRKEWNSYK